MIGSFEHWLCWQVSSASQLPNEQQFFIVGKFDFLSGELGTPPIASEQSHHSPLLLAGITVRFHTDRYYRSGFTKEILVQVLQQIARRRKPPGREPQQTFRWGPSVQGGVPKLVVSWHSTPFMGCLGRWTPSRNSCKILSSLERSSPWVDPGIRGCRSRARQAEISARSQSARCVTEKCPRGQPPVSEVFLVTHLLRRLCGMLQINKMQNTLENSHRAQTRRVEMATCRQITCSWSGGCGFWIPWFGVPRGHPGTLNDELGGPFVPPLFALGVVQFCLLSAFAIQPVTWCYCR